MLARAGRLSVAGDKYIGEVVVAPQVGGIYQTQTRFRTNVRAPSAENAFVSIKNRANVTAEAARGLDDGDRIWIRFLDLRNPDAALDR